MERVASLLERQMTSSRAQNSGASEQGPSQRLLSSPSVDSLAGLRSPGTATPETQEPWQLREATGAAELDPGDSSPVASPFAAAAQLPLEAETETVIVTQSRQFHALMRPGNRRFASAMNTQNKPEAVRQWKGHSSLLLVWFAAATATAVMSLPWFQLGMWAGLLGCCGALFGVCGDCCCGVEIHINLQVTRIMAIAVGMLSVWAVALWTFLLVGLPCPKSVRTDGYCTVFRTGLGAMALWFLFLLGLVGIVAAKATRIKALIDPVIPRNVIVLRTARSTPA